MKKLATAVLVFVLSFITGVILMDLAIAQEPQEATLTVRVSNPLVRFGNLFSQCGPRAKSLGLVTPEETSTFTVEVVDIYCAGDGRFGVVMENGSTVWWDSSGIGLDEEGTIGYLMCIHPGRSVLFRTVFPNEVPPFCPNNTSRDLTDSLRLSLYKRV